MDASDGSVCTLGQLTGSWLSRSFEVQTVTTYRL